MTVENAMNVLGVIRASVEELFNVSAGGPMTLSQANAMNRALARLQQAAEMIEGGLHD
jgi:hypothetical protein